MNHQIQELVGPRLPVPKDLPVELLAEHLLAEHVRRELLVGVRNGHPEARVADQVQVPEVPPCPGVLPQQQAHLFSVQALVQERHGRLPAELRDLVVLGAVFWDEAGAVRGALRYVKAPGSGGRIISARAKTLVSRFTTGKLHICIYL